MTEQTMGKKVDEAIKKFFSNIDTYFKSLNEKEIIAWIIIGVGVILVVLGIIFI